MLRDILQNLDKIQQNNCQLVHSLFEPKYGILPRIMLSLLEHCFYRQVLNSEWSTGERCLTTYKDT